MSNDYEAQERAIPLACRQLNDKMGGGIPDGSLVLVDGRFDSGKSLVSQHIVWSALQAGYRVAFYVTEHGVSSLLREMQQYGMEVGDYFLLGRLNIYPVPQAPQGSSGVSFTTLREHFSRLAGFDVVVVDALTTFASGASDEEVLAFFAACRRCTSLGKTVTITVHSHALSASLLEQLRSVCNTHLRLKLAHFKNRLVNVLEIPVVRDAETSRRNAIAFVAEPGVGVDALPFTTTRS